jgi:hypothetical protein
VPISPAYSRLKHPTNETTSLIPTFNYSAFTAALLRNRTIFSKPGQEEEGAPAILKN